MAKTKRTTPTAKAGLSLLMLAVLMGPLLALLPTPTAAALGIGDPAPPLAQGEYVQGEPVAELEAGTVYIVEFWATWCGPCVDAIPHVNALQQKYADQGVVVIGQNVWENDTSKVVPFVEQMGEDMTYRVALDRDDQMAETWMKAADQNGIPAAFIVDRAGKIAWIGHPMGMDQPLAEIVAGTYDPEAAATQQAKLQAIEQQIGEAMEAGDVDKAVALMDEAAALLPADMKPMVALGQFQMYAQADRMEEAYGVLSPMIETSEDAELLNEVAWMLVSPDSPVADPDLEVASSAATKSNELSNHDEPDFLDTLARVQHLMGEHDEAVATQRKAIEKAEAQDADAAMLEYLKEGLSTYEQAGA
ncbi:MAG: redoxin family protein [Planctomycetota bacterium]